MLFEDIYSSHVGNLLVPECLKSHSNNFLGRGKAGVYLSNARTALHCSVCMNIPSSLILAKFCANYVISVPEWAQTSP